MVCFFICNAFLLHASCNPESSGHDRVQNENSKGCMVHFAESVKKHDHGVKLQPNGRLKPIPEENSDDLDDTNFDSDNDDQAAFVITEKISRFELCEEVKEFDDERQRQAWEKVIPVIERARALSK